jgi:hemerythrin HHE cation binding domain-containing protein
MTAIAERVDTQEMVIVHRVFRREFRQAPELIRGVAGGDRTRAAVVAEHLADMATALHHHHTGEDKLLWPLLLERTSMHTGLIQRMEDQHERLARALDTVEELLPRWRADADPTTRDRLAEAVATVFAGLDEHLTDEENELLPIVPEHITPAEWHTLGEHGRDALPRNSKAFVFLGLILQDASPAERGSFLRNIPPPIRLAHRLFGSRIHRRYVARLYG